MHLNLEESKAWDIAQKLYREGPRFYHSFRHAMDVLERVDKIELQIGFQNYEAARVAALFHDAIFVVGCDDNELNSANEMKRVMYDVYPDSEELSNIIDDAYAMILSTNRHMTHQKFFPGWDTMLFMDCDVLGFAARWIDFQIYNQQIKAEFASKQEDYDEKKYRTGQIDFFTKLYQKGVFRSPYVRKTSERLALLNIKDHLEGLGVVI